MLSVAVAAKVAGRVMLCFTRAVAQALQAVESEEAGS